MPTPPKKTKKTVNLDTDLTFFKKINSKWITDINVRCRTIKLLEDNVGENLDDHEYSNDVLSIIYQRHNP